MGDYLRTFLRFDPPAIRRAVLLNFAAALTEGAGLLMLLPLLSLAGVLEQGGGQKAWMPQLGQFFSSFGLAWNIESALLVFVALIFVQSQLVLRRNRVSHALQLRFGDHLRKTLYAAITRANWSFLTGHHSGELSSVLTSEVQRIGNGTYFLLRLFTIAVLGLAYLAVALWLSIRLTLLALATGLALWLLLRGADVTAKQSGVMLSQANRSLFGQIQEFLRFRQDDAARSVERLAYARQRYDFDRWRAVATTARLAAQHRVYPAGNLDSARHHSRQPDLGQCRD